MILTANRTPDNRKPSCFPASDSLFIRKKRKNNNNLWMMNHHYRCFCISEQEFNSKRLKDGNNINPRSKKLNTNMVWSVFKRHNPLTASYIIISLTMLQCTYHRTCQKLCWSNNDKLRDPWCQSLGMLICSIWSISFASCQ